MEPVATIDLKDKADRIDCMADPVTIDSKAGPITIHSPETPETPHSSEGMASIGSPELPATT